MMSRLSTMSNISKNTAKIIQKNLEKEIRGNIEKGQDYDGKKWAPLKKQKNGSRKALKNAGDELYITRRGLKITARVRGWYALHNWGTARGNVLREILPKIRIPESWIDLFFDAIEEAAQKKWRR